MKLHFINTHLVLLMFLTIICLIATGFSAFMFFDTLGGKIVSVCFLVFLIVFFILMIAVCYKLVNMIMGNEEWVSYQDPETLKSNQFVLESDSRATTPYTESFYSDNRSSTPERPESRRSAPEEYPY